MATAAQSIGGGGFFQPATRYQVRGRVAIDGPSGGGKTFSGLRFATGLVAYLDHHVGGKDHKLAVINSESGAVEKYMGLSPDGIEWKFDIGSLQDFSPTTYAARIEEAGRAGYDVLLIDSLSHAWAGVGGALELKDKQGGNSYTAWKNITPMHNRMVEMILNSPCHVIVTMRSKTEFILELNEKGKQVPRKIGMAPVQRPGMEYEFDLYCSLDWAHTMTVTKSRCPAMDGKVVVKPDTAFFQPFFEWLTEGAEAPEGYYALRESDLQKAAQFNPKIAAEQRQQQMAAGAAAQGAEVEQMAAGAAAQGAEVDSLGQFDGSGSLVPPASNPKPSDYSRSLRQEERESMKAPCSLAQVVRIIDLLVECDVPPEARASILRRRGVGKLDELSTGHAKQLIEALEAKLRGMTIAESLNKDNGGTVGNDQ